MGRSSCNVLSVFLFLLTAFCGPHSAFCTEQADFYTVLSLGGEAGGPILGKAVFHVRENATEMDYRIVVDHIDDITMAHLHLGPVGELSTPVVWLYPESPPPKLIPGEFSGLLAEGTVTAQDLVGPLRGKPLSFLIEQMQEGNVFVNIHADRSAAGEICGAVQCPMP